MVNLVKCELVKMFHKKIFTVMSIITIMFAGLLFFINKSEDGVNSVVSGVYLSVESQNIESIDKNNPANKDYYANEKASFEIFKYEKEKGWYSSWQGAILDEKGNEILINAYGAEFDNDIDSYNMYMDEYNKLLDDLNNKDWKYFSNIKIKDLNQDIENLTVENEKLNNELEVLTKQYDELVISLESVKESDKEELKNTILELDEQIKMMKETIRYNNDSINVSSVDISGLEYRIKYDIPTEYSGKSNLVNIYIDNKTQYLDMINNDVDQKSADFKNIKSTYLVSEYKLDNGLINTEYDSAHYNIITLVSYFIFFVTIFVAIVSGSIMADEFNKGTIKQLLLKPYTRTQIFVSKLIASIILFLVYYLFYLLVYGIMYGILYGFGSYLEPNVVYDFGLDKVIEVNFFKQVMLYFVSILPFYIIIMLFSYTLSIITGNAAVAMGAGFALSVGGDILNALIMLTKKKIFAFIPTLCWDLTPYLYGGVHQFKYCTFAKSLSVDLACIVLLFSIGLVVFNKMDIKNQ